MAYGTNEANAKASNTVIGVMRDIDVSLHRVAKTVQHLDTIGDRLEGSRPQEAACGEPDTPPHSTINEMQRIHGRIQMLASQLESATARLDNAVGGNETKLGAPNRIA